MIKWIDFPSITPKIFALKFILVGVAVAAVLFHSTNLVYFHHYVVSDDDDDRVRDVDDDDVCTTCWFILILGPAVLCFIKLN
jgi:hypothetical protein